MELCLFIYVLVVLGFCCCAQAFSVAVRRFLVAVASLVVEHRF